MPKFVRIVPCSGRAAYQFMHSATCNMDIKYFIGSFLSVQPWYFLAVNLCAWIYRVTDITNVVAFDNTHVLQSALEEKINQVSRISNFICMCVCYAMDVAFLPVAACASIKRRHNIWTLSTSTKTVDSVAFTKLIDTRRAYIFPFFFGNNKKIVGIL